MHVLCACICLCATLCLLLQTMLQMRRRRQKPKQEPLLVSVKNTIFLNVSINIVEFAVTGLQVRCYTVDVIVRMFTQEPMPQLEPV